MTKSSSATLAISAQQAIFRPALVLMTGRFLGFFAAFAIPMVLARLFDQQEFGTYKQLFLIFATLFGIAQAGMAESLYYFLPYDSRRSGGYIFNTLLVLGTLGTGSFALLWWFREDLALLLNNVELSSYIPLVGIYLLLMLMSVVLEILMTIRKQHVMASSSYGLSDLLRALCYISPALLFAELNALMLGAIAFAGARLAAVLFYVHHEYGASLRPDKDALRLHLSYAIPFGAAALIEVIQINYHLYAVSYFFDAATFAIYAVGCLQIPISDFLMTSTCNVMMVNMRESLKEEDHTAVVAIWLDSNRKLALVFFPMVAGLILVADPLIVLLFTKDYSDSVPIFMICALSMLFAAILTDGALRVFGETRFLIFQNFVRLIIVVAFMPWFLHQFHLAGAIIVTLLATLVSKLLALYKLRSVMQVELSQLLPWRSLLATLVIAVLSAVPAVAISAAITMPDIGRLIVTMFVYSVTYYWLLQWIGPMDHTEKAMLSQWLASPFQRLGRILRA